MRNTPLAFVGDDTIQQLSTVYHNRQRSAPVARTAGVRVDDVAENWSAIEQHKWFLSEHLGRDAGMEVAALDYLQNVRHRRIPATWLSRVWQGLLANLDGDGPQSIVNLERAFSPRNQRTR